ncbi:hypothetical protein [Clostridium cylindrosporum]|uniref:Aminopeptidase n=1 Tax=Clostridium cylindrosporum DSM 605 TaxID=1121307 RepID=A0A0J8DG53_CLOCY|nr:hypothetical protein [Clostridium cylindrosporum]KMT23148.1 hypothetical protein CLCY_6c00290 [Clostridium cylindrosporum DSM 605]
MNPKHSRMVYTTLTCIIVLVLLISNLGNNFKTDVFSYKDIIENIEKLKSNWLSSFTEEEYTKITSDYISSKLKNFSLEPIEIDGKKSYIQNFSRDIPFEETKSYIQVISKHDNVIRSYKHGDDFIEDISGLFSSKYVKGNAQILNSTTFKEDVPSILLLDNYKSMSSYNVENFDEKLEALGVSAIIYPDIKEKIIDKSTLFNIEYTPTSNGILKFCVSNETYNELSSFIKKGYKLRLKSGMKIKSQTLTNVYGKVQGTSKKYKPLIIASFYDGDLPSRFRDNKGSLFEANTYTPSILLEFARIIKLQETINPDRTIIFAFISGKAIDKIGLDVFRNLNITGDFLLLDDIGNSSKFNLTVHKNSKDFSNTINHFMIKNDLKIVSSTTNNYIHEESAYLFGINNIPNGLNFNSSYNTCKFILSLIADECYNLDFITAYYRDIRAIKRFLKDYTIPIATISLIFITFVVFRYPEIKNTN